MARSDYTTAWKEREGARDLRISEWHRSQLAPWHTFADLDGYVPGDYGAVLTGVEYNCRSFKPAALVEYKHHAGREYFDRCMAEPEADGKPHPRVRSYYALRSLADAASIPLFLVWYDPDDEPEDNPTEWRFWVEAGNDRATAFLSGVAECDTERMKALMERIRR